MSMIACSEGRRDKVFAGRSAAFGGAGSRDDQGSEWIVVAFINVRTVAVDAGDQLHRLSGDRLGVGDLESAFARVNAVVEQRRVHAYQCADRRRERGLQRCQDRQLRRVAELFGSRYRDLLPAHLRFGPGLARAACWKTSRYSFSSRRGRSRSIATESNSLARFVSTR